MRITQSIITRNLLQSINRSRENMNFLQGAIASGKEIRQSSDDPVQFARATRFRKTISQNEQYLRNITNSQGWIGTTSGVLDELYQKIMDAKETAIQGANEGLDVQNRSMMANIIDDNLDVVDKLINSKYLGKYLFGGTETQGDEEPFTYDGLSITYNGNTNSISRRVAENMKISINVNGQQLLDTGIFAALINLRDALNSNDTDAIQSSIGELETVSDNFLSLSSSVGSIQNQIQMIEQRLEAANINLASYLSQAEDVDMVEAITKYNTEELAYQAALQTTSNAIQLNILDFIR